MRNIKKSGFTLVELIVVITILAILGTIAFVSLQGYSADARNSKRTSDLNSIQSAMSTTLAGGQPIMSFVISNTGSQISSGDIAGAGVSVGTDYDAGTTNFPLLKMNGEEFTDPSGGDYRIGVTTKNYGQYQVAASMENGSAPRIARLAGNYFKRESSKGIRLTKQASDLKGKIMTIDEPKDANYFNMNDYIVMTGSSSSVRVTNIKGGTVIYVDTENSAADGDWHLASDEVEGLIKGVNSSDVVENNGEVLPY